MRLRETARGFCARSLRETVGDCAGKRGITREECSRLREEILHETARDGLIKHETARDCAGFRETALECARLRKTAQN